MAKQSFLERFYSKCDIGDPDTCWPWTSATVCGYGVITVRPGAQEYAHRMMWVLETREPIPPDRLVCHSCDNRGCVNPAHLYLGTNKDRVRASNLGRAKTTPGEVKDMRERFARGEVTAPELAEEKDMSRCNIYMILHGESWQNAGGPIVTERIVNPSRGNTKLSPEQVEEARRRIAAGESQAAVAREMGVHYSHMSRIVRGERW